MALPKCTQKNVKKAQIEPFAEDFGLKPRNYCLILGKNWGWP